MAWPARHRTLSPGPAYLSPSPGASPHPCHPPACHLSTSITSFGHSPSPEACPACSRPHTSLSPRSPVRLPRRVPTRFNLPDRPSSPPTRHTCRLDVKSSAGAAGRRCRRDTPRAINTDTEAQDQLTSCGVCLQHSHDLPSTLQNPSLAEISAR